MARLRPDNVHQLDALLAQCLFHHISRLLLPVDLAAIGDRRAMPQVDRPLVAVVQVPQPPFPPGRLERFLLENRTVGADEALRLGLVGEVVPDEQFDARLAEYGDLIAERSPVTTRLTKRGLTRATAIDLEAQVRFELSNIRRAFASQDAQEARRAFFEKRSPVFHGR